MRSFPVKAQLCGLACLVVCNSACKPEPPVAQTLTVFAASSLTEAFEDLAAQFQEAHPTVSVALNLAGSQTLRVQIENGAGADVFAAARPSHVEALAQAGRVATSTTFAWGELVIVVPRANPLNIQGLADLERVKRLVVGDATVPVGEYTAQTLERASTDLGEARVANIQAHIASHELDVRMVLAKVAMGEADAGIVYRTDAATSDRVVAVPIPAIWAPPARYVIAALEPAQHPKAAQAFLRFVSSPAGRAILTARGFQTRRPGASTSSASTAARKNGA